MAADFRLDHEVVQAIVDTGKLRSSDRSHVEAALAHVRGHDSLSPEEIATLWFAPTLGDEHAYELALGAWRRRARRLETFSPLYLTNTCDAECRMCGMRRDNQALVRETAPQEQIARQLDLLGSRGMRAVALLTGEYRGDRRRWALDQVNRALRATQEMEFGHVLINAGSIEDEEFDTLLEGLQRAPDGALARKITMCTFQETYSRPHYERFMGTDPENPRADFERRLANFDRARRAGMRVANPGILLGLNPDLAFEMTSLVLHARHLRGSGMEVYLSVPRLRQIAGGRSQGGVEDGAFVRLVALLSLGLPDCKIVLTTRESREIQQKLVPIVSVLSAGSAAVAPYTADGARFPLETSQFEVVDQRPFEEILAEHLPRGESIENFETGSV